MSDSERFLNALAGDLPADERLILCGFVGDPETAGQHAWRPRPWRPGRDIPINERANGYVTVGSFLRAGDGSFRRRAETFAAGLALMVDDVGTKVPLATLLVPGQQEPLLLPSAVVETSAGNFQWWYFLSRPERDMARFDGVIRAFISGKLLGADPGMSGVTRVGRIPGFVNGKAKHSGWVAALRALRPEARYSIDDLLRAFDLTINGRRVQREVLATEEAIERNRAYAGVFKFLAQRGMLKKDEPDMSGWTEMTCFNVSEHTNSADNGAAIREPAPENDFYGAFRCFHTACCDFGFSDLTEWINETAAAELDDSNAQG